MLDEGEKLTKRSEGCKLKAYKDCVGVWTIGYGHTGPDVYEGLVITQEQANQLLRIDIKKFEIGVRKSLTVGLLDAQKDALTDFSFNLGLGALRASTLLKKVNRGIWRGIDKEFNKWVNAGGIPRKGLIIRRAAEARMFCNAIKEI